jgi:hypothetical protein
MSVTGLRLICWLWTVSRTPYGSEAFTLNSWNLLRSMVLSTVSYQVREHPLLKSGAVDEGPAPAEARARTRARCTRSNGRAVARNGCQATCTLRLVRRAGDGRVQPLRKL